MEVKIQPSSIQGTIQASASKSSMQRACAAALLVNGKTIIQNPGFSHDDKAAIAMVEALGAECMMLNSELIINSNGVKPISKNINIGESGLGLRMFTPIIALSNEAVFVNGKGSLLTRPMDFFNEIFPQLDVKFSNNNGKLPFEIQGPLNPKNITIDGSLSSQFLTGLLMAYSANITNEVTITVNNLNSKPYIDLTLDVMKNFGMNMPENKNYEKFIFHKSDLTEQTIDEVKTYTVEGDWSGAAFLLVAGAIAGSITVKGLDMMSTQADNAIIDVLISTDANIAIEAKAIKIHKSELKAFDFDATDCPDLFPPLVALAAYCNGNSSIKGVSRLMHKESNRALTLQEEFGKMGVEIELENDLMIVKGGSIVKGAVVNSHNDHRIAMSCAVAALAAKGETIIKQANAINKSYPSFYEDLNKLKASIVNPFTFDKIIFGE